MMYKKYLIVLQCMLLLCFSAVQAAEEDSLQRERALQVLRRVFALENRDVLVKAIDSVRNSTERGDTPLAQ